MLPIILLLSAFLVAALALLGAMRFLEAGYRQKAAEVEELLKAESASLQRQAEELDAGLVESIAGSGDAANDAAAMITAWQKGRAGLLEVIGEKPWNWGTHSLQAWREEQLRIRCGNLDEQLKKQKVIAAVAILGVSIAAGVGMYAAAAWSYFGTK
jgi:hypothetical protein